MKVGIMQPYFFPYIGYFQLINAVDVYVNLDHVNFMPRSYMTRNSIKSNIPISISVTNSSQNKKCIETMVILNDSYRNKFFKTLNFNYSKSKNYDNIISLIEENFYGDKSISEFNLFFIKRICEYLDINTKIIDSSTFFDDCDLKKEKNLISITKQLNSNHYVNAIGGQKLYDKNDFYNQNINLSFIKMNNLDFENPYTSILDLIFTYDKEYIKNELNKYEMI